MRNWQTGTRWKKQEKKLQVLKKIKALEVLFDDQDPAVGVREYPKQKKIANAFIE